MVAQAPACPASGNPNNPTSEEASSSAHIYMFNGIDLTNRTTTYDTLTKRDKEKVTNDTISNPPSTNVNPQYGTLHIEKPTFNSILHPPKRIIRKSTFNPSSCVAQN
jgi:hypothetical protein